MRIFLLLAVVCSLSSCNTMIGLWRDTKEAAKWTGEKIQGMRNGGGGGGGADDSGAPVY